MKINYNVTGQERKKLVNAISQEFNTTPRYLGAPTFAYEVDISMNSVITIDRNGVIFGTDNRELIEKLRENYGLEAVEEEYTANHSETNEENTAVHSETIAESPAITVDSDSFTISIPKDAYNEKAIDNIEKIVKSKSTLIKKALDVDALPIDQTDTTLDFPWFNTIPDAEKIKVYSAFILALCNTAKNQIRASAIEKTVENEKYAFRCFLLKIGFIGDEYKIHRKILLANLSGDSSFKNKVHRRNTATGE